MLASLLHTECQTEMSNGAGIQPRKAIRKIMSFSEKENDFEEPIFGVSAPNESTIATMVVIANKTIITFINLSSNL